MLLEGHFVVPLLPMFGVRWSGEYHAFECTYSISKASATILAQSGLEYTFDGMNDELSSDSRVLLRRRAAKDGASFRLPGITIHEHEWVVLERPIKCGSLGPWISARFVDNGQLFALTRAQCKKLGDIQLVVRDELSEELLAAAIGYSLATYIEI